MKILWFTWKDKKSPLAGGAEVVNEELAKRLVLDGNEVIFLVAGYEGCPKEEIIDGYRVIRLGNRYTVYWEAFRYYAENLKGWADLVIDEMNTIPFFTKFYVKEKRVMFIHQLCREIWFYQMFFPLSLIGYIIEPIYLWMLNSEKVITVSESTKKDLIRYGFREENVRIISEGIDIEPVPDLKDVVKSDKFTILSLGSVRSMKRTLEIVKAFEMAKKRLPCLKLIVAGDTESDYGKKVLRHIDDSEYRSDISCLGRVDRKKKMELMQRSHLICVTSVKEGWGLIVTEANSQGTPAIVYDVDGLRDSVRNGETGIVCKENSPECLAESVISMLRDKESYAKLRQKAWETSREITFERSYKEFLMIIKG
ncbi:MAG: glycosyltransferase family 4 protein [Candidatus Pacebacteria bacterium]|nr:glycosyltransferase family 4 protein [Candidatus Paceibacterota bacterium]